MTTLSIVEEVEDAEWPAPPAGLSAAAAALPRGLIWRRIESWIAWRWGLRLCTFIAEGGCGSWRAPLCPFAVETTEAWNGEAWEAVTLQPSPLGGVMLGSASHYRFAGMLGADDVPPADVLEAYRRLAEYFASTPNEAAGSTSERQEIGSLAVQVERAPTWLARAMSYSGCADLLRPYRRAP
jgi:hypothetical protein